jgi:ABC-type glycerol-3-phosphate transport system substrate-binding protein
VRYLKKSWQILFLVMLLASCTWIQQWVGEVPVPSPTPTSTILPTPSPVVTPTRALATIPRRLTLKLWVPAFLDPYSGEPGGNALTAQLKAFTIDDDTIQVEVIAKKDTGPGGLLNLLSTAFDVAPSVLPDVIVLNKGDLKDAVNEGLVQSIDGVSVSWSDFFPFAAGPGAEESDVYGIPFIADADHMVYRSGIADTPPISWTAVVTNGYSMLFPVGSPEGLANDALLAAYIGSGGSVMDENGQPLLERVYLEQLYAFFFDMVRRDLIDTDTALNLPDTQAAWKMYQQGMGDMSPVPLGLYWQNPPQDSLPIWMPNAREIPTTIVQSWFLAVVTSDPNRQLAAQTLISWLVDPLHMAEFSRVAQLVPTRRQAERLWGIFPEDQPFIYSLLVTGIPAPPAEADVPVRRALQFGLIAVLRQDVDTPEEAATYAMTNLRR